MHAASSLVLNAIKEIAGILHDVSLLSDEILESITS